MYKSLTMRLLLSVICLFVVIGWSGAGPHASDSAAADLPNILVFIVDDAGWSDFGTYGNDAIRTPNVDALAASGLKVEHAFLTTAQCSPSRISILTGRYPHATGAEDLHMPLPDGTTIVPGYLQKQGYFTGHMQKTHYGSNGNAQFQWYNQETAPAFPEFLDAAGDQPFFLWVGFNDPHRDYQPGAVDPPHDPTAVKVPLTLADTPETRADLALYYDEISRMDEQIGRFMAELDRRGLRENTLVVFLSDNGMPFPRAKGTVYDAGVRTPLIFSWPAQIEAGKTYDGLVSVIDLAPTWLDIAGLETPDTMQGSSIRTIFTDQTVPGRTYVYSERNWHDCDEHIRSLRTERFKLIRNAYIELPHGTAADIGGSPSFRSLIRLKKQNKLTHAQAQLFQVPRPRIELYDLEKDPWEINNVADEDAYWAKARELAAVLDTWIEETSDFPPDRRIRDDHTDRMTGVWFSSKIPPMRNME
jgi:arylsulfatase A-like enzyme